MHKFIKTGLVSIAALVVFALAITCWNIAVTDMVLSPMAFVNNVIGNFYVLIVIGAITSPIWVMQLMLQHMVLGSHSEAADDAA
jgi:hypothetical protein